MVLKFNLLDIAHDLIKYRIRIKNVVVLPAIILLVDDNH